MQTVDVIKNVESILNISSCVKNLEKRPPAI